MLMVFLSNRENGNVVGAFEYNCTQFTWRFVIGLKKFSLVNRNGFEEILFLFKIGIEFLKHEGNVDKYGPYRSYAAL